MAVAESVAYGEARPDDEAHNADADAPALGRIDHRVFQLAFEQDPDGMALIDTEGRWVMANSALRQMLGHGEAGLEALSLAEVLAGDDLPVDPVPLQQLLAGEVRSYTVERGHRASSGHSRWLQLRVAVVHGAFAQYFIVHSSDLTVRKQAEDELAYQALHDPLTGLANRALLSDRLAQAETRSDRYGHLFAVLFVDIDGFKSVNDTFGHPAGDEVLSEVACRLRSGLRSSDTAARLGGDEFVVLFEVLSDERAADGVLERISAELARPYVLSVSAAPVTVTASIGMAVGSAGERGEELLRRADRAMYVMKSGRGLSRHPLLGDAS